MPKMTERDGGWTGEWVARALREHSAVKDVQLVEPQVLRVDRKEHSSFAVATLGLPRVNDSDVDQALAGPSDVEFLVNVPRESFWTGEAIKAAIRHKVGFGGLRDLMSATADEHPRLYQNKEFAFVERGLRQHTRVSSFDRLNDRQYLIKRHGRGDLTIVLLNEYELTAEHVRAARDRYGAFDLVVKTNPNGGVSSAAERAASSMGASIHKWGDFLARLNK